MGAEKIVDFGVKYVLPWEGRVVVEKIEVERQKPKALEGDVIAQLKVGDYYAENDKYAEASKWYGMATDQGNFTAIARLGIYHIIGRGVTRNPAKGLEMVRRAAYSGNDIGQCALGEYYYHGSVGLPVDEREAQRWLSLSALQGNKEAKRVLRRRGLTLDSNATLPADAPAHMAPQNAVAAPVRTPVQPASVAPSPSPVGNDPSPAASSSSPTAGDVIPAANTTFSAAASKACTSCGAQIPAMATFCPICGSKQNDPARFCTHCGAALLPGAKFCQICGTKFA